MGKLVPQVEKVVIHADLKKSSSKHHKKPTVLKSIKKIQKIKKALKHKLKKPIETSSKNENSKSIEVEDDIVEEKEESKKQKNTITTLSKFWRTSYEMPAIYTGGKIMFSVKKKLIFSIANYTIFVFDYETKETVKKIIHENEEISNFTFNQQENTLVTFTKNFLLRCIDLHTFDVTKTIKVPENSFALDMVFDPSGRFLALGTPQGLVKVFDVKKGIQTHEFKGHRGSIRQLFFNPDFQNYQIISVSEDGMLKIFDLVANACLQTNNTNISFSSLSLTDDGSKLYGYDNLVVYVYDVRNLSLLKKFNVSEDFLSINHFKINDEEFLIAGGEHGTLKIFDLNKENFDLSEEKTFRNPNITTIVSFKNKHQIGIVTGEQNILIFEVKLHESKLIFKLKETVIGFNDEIIDLKYIKSSKDSLKGNKDTLIMATNSSLIKVFNKKEKKFSMFTAHSETVLSVDAIDDILISSSKDKSIKLWKLKEQENNTNYELIATFTGHLESVGCVAIAPRTTSFFISGSVDKSIKVWSIKQAMKNHQTQKKASAKKKEDLEISNALRSIYAHEKDINALKFAPNEKFFASASQDKTIKIWDSSSFAAKYILRGHKRGVWDIAFSPIEKLLVSSSGDATLKIWNLADGSCLNTLEGHNGSVLKVNWLCFGLEIVSGGSDGLIKLWNYKKGLCINTFEKHEGKIWALDVSEQVPNAKQEIVSGANDSLFCVWEDTTIEEEQKVQEESHKTMIEQQNINNALRNRDFYEAGRIAFRNGMVKNFQTALEYIFNEVEFKNEIIYSELETSVKAKKNEEISQFEEKFMNFLREIVETDVNKLLIFIRDMNSTAKYCKIAQRTLHYLFKITPLDKFKEFRNKFVIKEKKSKKKTESMQKKKKEFDELLDVLIAYSEKHVNRTQNFIKKSFYLDFMLKKLNLFNLEEQKE